MRSIYISLAEWIRVFLDLGKVCKMSMPRLIAFSIANYLDEVIGSLIKRPDNNRYKNYTLIGRVVDGILCWTYYWGVPKNLEVKTWKAIFMTRTRLVILISLLILIDCATFSPASIDAIHADMESVARGISVDRSYMYTLGNRRIGKTGYYYVLDTDGRVVFHPRSALIGTSFSKVLFIDQLLGEKSGCLTYTLGNRKHYLFFMHIDDSEILCLSIVSEDLPQAVECNAARVRPAD